MKNFIDIVISEIACFAGLWEWAAYVYIPTLTSSGIFN